LKIDVSNKNIHKPAETIDVGMGAQLNISKFKKVEVIKKAFLRRSYSVLV